MKDSNMKVKYPGVATLEVKDKWGRALYDEDGQRLTSCCGCYSTYQDGFLCCKRCYEFVPIGEGDGSEYRDTEEEVSDGTS